MRDKFSDFGVGVEPVRNGLSSMTSSHKATGENQSATEIEVSTILTLSFTGHRKVIDSCSMRGHKAIGTRSA